MLGFVGSRAPIACNSQFAFIVERIHTRFGSIVQKGMFWAGDIAHHMTRPLAPVSDIAAERREPTKRSRI